VAVLAACAAPSSSAGGSTLHRGPEAAGCTPSEAWEATRNGQWRLAAARWNDLVQRGGAEDPIACREAGRALSRIGDDEGALEVLNMGLERAPGDPELLEVHGNVLDRMGFRRAAEESFEDALAAAPDRVSVLRSLGRVRLDLDRAAAALEPLERCRELGATDTETRLLRARALACAGQGERALEAFTEALTAADVTAEELAAAAALMCEEREVPGCRHRSRAWLERAVALDPSCAAAHYQLGRFHAARHDLDAAAACWRRTIELDPDHVPALQLLAEWYADRGNEAQAARFARKAEQASRRVRR